MSVKIFYKTELTNIKIKNQVMCTLALTNSRSSVKLENQKVSEDSENYIFRN